MVCRPVGDGDLGIHSIVVRRDTLLAKHVAIFLLCLDSIWISMMMAIYGLVPIEWDTRVGQNCFAIWRELVARAPDVLLQTRWILGNGRSINFISDPWITDLPLAWWPTFITMDISDSISIFRFLIY